MSSGWLLELTELTIRKCQWDYGTYQARVYHEKVNIDFLSQFFPLTFIFIYIFIYFANIYKYILLEVTNELWAKNPMKIFHFSLWHIWHI